MNAVAYNEALDQIIISSRNLSEIYIIEHSPTTEIAAAPRAASMAKVAIFSIVGGIRRRMGCATSNGAWEVVCQFNLNASLDGAFRCRQYSDTYIEQAARSSGETGI